MRKLIAAAVVTTSLAGCITTPSEVIEQGTTHTGTLKGAAEEAAACIARGIETRGDWLTSTHKRGDAVEIYVRVAQGHQPTMAVWRIQSAGNDSKYTAHVSASVLVNHGGIVKRMRGDCL